MDTLEKVREIIEGLDLPSEVVDFICEPFTDSTGDPAVWIYLIFDDRVFEDRRSFYERERALESRIADALTRARVDWFPHFRIRSSSEQEAIRQGTY